MKNNKDDKRNFTAIRNLSSNSTTKDLTKLQEKHPSDFHGNIYETCNNIFETKKMPECARAVKDGPSSGLNKNMVKIKYKKSTNKLMTENEKKTTINSERRSAVQNFNVIVPQAPPAITLERTTSSEFLSATSTPANRPLAPAPAASPLSELPELKTTKPRQQLDLQLVQNHHHQQEQQQQQHEHNVHHYHLNPELEHLHHATTSQQNNELQTKDLNLQSKKPRATVTTIVTSLRQVTTSAMKNLRKNHANEVQQLFYTNEMSAFFGTLNNFILSHITTTIASSTTTTINSSNANKSRSFSLPPSRGLKSNFTPSASSSQFCGQVLVLLTVASLFGNAHAGFACLSNPCVFGVCIDGLNR